LSETPPDVPNKKEDLPEFMITYKPENDEKKEQEQTVNPAESSQSISDNAQTTMPNVEPKDEKNPIVDSETTTVTDVPQIVQTQVLSIDTSTTSTASNITTTPHSTGSPVWLDALIAGLVSFIAVLVCRKYVF
jgi:outer membrane biosynthesis protein TonB